MTKNEWMFLACFTYLAILSTLSIVYWLDRGTNTWLVTLNYLMIMTPGFYGGVRLILWGKAGKKRRVRKKKQDMAGLKWRRLVINALGILIFGLSGALLIHTVLIWV